MDRRVRLAERRAAVEADYDTDAPSYDDGLYPISDIHRGEGDPRPREPTTASRFSVD